MRTLCAWCQAEGKEGVLKEGDKSGPISHGICESHLEKLVGVAAKIVTPKKNPIRRRRAR